MSLKSPVTPPRINPETVRLVQQGINHYATPGPRIQDVSGSNLAWIQTVLARKLQDYLPTSNLTLNLLTTTIVAPPSNASKWQMGFNSASEGLRTEKWTQDLLARKFQDYLPISNLRTEKLRFE